MSRISHIIWALCAAGLSTYAATAWNGKLLDAACAAPNTTTKTSSDKVAKSCAPSAATTTYAIESDGKIFSLDAGGNEKVAAAMRNDSLKADKNGDIVVNVSGTAEGSTIKVDSVTPSRAN